MEVAGREADYRAKDGTSLAAADDRAARYSADEDQNLQRIPVRSGRTLALSPRPPSRPIRVHPHGPSHNSWVEAGDRAVHRGTTPYRYHAAAPDRVGFGSSGRRNAPRPRRDRAADSTGIAPLPARLATAPRAAVISNAQGQNAIRSSRVPNDLRSKQNPAEWRSRRQVPRHAGALPNASSQGASDAHGVAAARPRCAEPAVQSPHTRWAVKAMEPEHEYFPLPSLLPTILCKTKSLQTIKALYGTSSLFSKQLCAGPALSLYPLGSCCTGGREAAGAGVGRGGHCESPRWVCK